MPYILLLFSLLTHKTPYCSCIPLGPIDEQQYNQYNLIVRGKVSKVSVGTLERTIHLTAGTYYKGGERQAHIRISTPRLEGMCGIVPKVGEEWLIFAYTDEYQLCVHPVIAGTGVPLFENINDRTILKFAKTKTFNGGAVILYYERQTR